MKTKETKGFGITGISVELSFVEILAIGKLAEELSETWIPGGTPLPVLKAMNFLRNLSSYQIKEEIERAGNDMFADKASIDAVKDMCDLNAIENETQQ